MNAYRAPSFGSLKGMLGILLIATVGTVGAVDEPSFRDLRGVEMKFSDYAGKWIVVNYWATWCPPCLKEIPDLVDFHDKHKESDAVVLGFNLEQIDTEKLKEFVDSYFISYPIIPMQNGTPMIGTVKGLPTTVLLSPKGEVVAAQAGPISAKSIEKFIEKSTGTKAVMAVNEGM